MRLFELFFSRKTPSAPIEPILEERPEVSKMKQMYRDLEKLDADRAGMIMGARQMEIALASGLTLRDAGDYVRELAAEYHRAAESDLRAGEGRDTSTRAVQDVQAAFKINPKAYGRSTPLDRYRELSVSRLSRPI